MPEEKKESFTFSDKIKNSKPAENKSFAKSSSKIGRDGKPKATLFQRTRRDAPFFIAALVALLLLPFLYKYSGQSSEEQLLTPGSDLTAFNPGEGETMLTTFNEDPSRQIAQLSGRDSLSLIKGWGANDEENVGRDDLDFDYDESASSAMDAEGRYDAEHASTSDVDIEENTTNIYKRRAKAGTRAAFRRAATKIGTLSPAHMGRPGGTGFGYKWGGSLKNAAKKVGPKGPTQGPKPVSLQPLRASAGRASFGGGNAAAARKGADNMGKANAREALRDSYVRPVDPTRTGGLDFTSGFTGGGAGKLDHHINIDKGETPWWWDMMKTRMQKEWEERFKRKWDWIKWADKLAQHILGGIINCLLTGTDDGDMGHFFGYGKGGGRTSGECCGVSDSKMSIRFGKELEYAKGDFEALCKAVKSSMPECKNGGDYKGPSSSAGESAGFFGARLGCLGIGLGFRGEASAHMHEGNGLACADISAHRYHVNTSKLPRKWQKHTYIYVVARNYRPASMPALSANAKRGFLCAEDDVFSIGGTFSGGVDDAQMPDKRTSGQDPNFYYTNYKNRGDRDSHHSVDTEIIGEQKIIANMYDRNPEDIGNACVIYIQKGNTFNYKNFQADTIANFLKMIKNGKYQREGNDKRSDEAIAADAFDQLDLMFIESFASEHKLAYAKWFETGNNLHEILPMVYWRFFDAFVEHYKSTNKATGSRTNVDNRKQRVFGVDSAMGDRCYLDESIKLFCKEKEEPSVVVKFGPRYKAGNFDSKNISDEAKNIQVTAEFRAQNEENGRGEQPFDQKNPIVTTIEGGTGLQYTLQTVIKKDQSDKEDLGAGESKIGNIVWKVYRKGAIGISKTGEEVKEAVYTLTCPYNLSGDGYTKHVTEKQCTSAQQDEECCNKLMTESGLMEGTDFIWDPSKPVGSQCVRLCTNPEQSAECCEQLRQGATWHEEPNAQGKHCYQGITPPPPSPTLGQTRLAPVLSWVPVGKVDCRQQAGDDVNPAKAVFSGCNAKITGVVEGQREHCGSQTPIMMDSQAAATFVRDVVTAYNATNPTMKLSDKFYSNTYPTDGEFVDALFIADQLGIAEVPSSAVCELARDMVRMSKDPHAGHLKVEEKNDFKDIPRFYRNDLGAFLVYVHPTSILYPNKYYGQEHEVCDWRFLPKGSTCGIKSTMQMGKAFYFNYYNDSKKNASLQSYLGSFDKVGIKKTYPLAAITEGHSDLAHNCPTQDCANTRNSYNKDDYFGLMISDMETVDGQGKACVAFAGNNKMSVKKAIEYVQNVCTTGLDAKPYGNQSRNGTVATSAAIYNPNQTFTQTTNSRPGHDTSVQTQSRARGRG